MRGPEEGRPRRSVDLNRGGARHQAETRAEGDERRRAEVSPTEATGTDLAREEADVRVPRGREPSYGTTCRASFNRLGMVAVTMRPFSC
jgi:hypothetical protein